MQNQRDKIRRKNNMQTSWPRITEKMHAEAEEGGTMFANGSPFCPVNFFWKICLHLNPKNEFRFQRPKKSVSDYDDVWHRRRHCLSANVPLERKWKTSQKNETGQLSRPITLYRHPNTAHYDIQWPQKLKRYPKLQPNRPKREMFEALMPVASSSSPTHDIYGNTVIIISVVVSFQRRNNCEHTQCSLWF